MIEHFLPAVFIAGTFAMIAVSGNGGEMRQKDPEVLSNKIAVDHYRIFGWMATEFAKANPTFAGDKTWPEMAAALGDKVPSGLANSTSLSSHFLSATFDGTGKYVVTAEMPSDKGAASIAQLMPKETKPMLVKDAAGNKMFVAEAKSVIAQKTGVTATDTTAQVGSQSTGVFIVPTMTGGAMEYAKMFGRD